MNNINWAGRLQKFIFSLFLSITFFAEVNSLAWAQYLPWDKERVRLSETELAKDTVLPIFDRVSVIKNRYITNSGRIEIALGSGINHTDALYKGLSLYGTGTYHFNEVHAVSLTGGYFLDGLSKEGFKFKNGEIPRLGRRINFQNVPHLRTLLLADYQLTALYGKISLTKNAVLNLSLYSLFGGGLVSFTEAKGSVSRVGNVGVSPALSLGFGVKAYLNNRVAFRYDLRVPMYRGVDPFHCETLGDADCSNSDPWGRAFYFPIISNLGLSFLF